MIFFDSSAIFIEKVFSIFCYYESIQYIIKLFLTGNAYFFFSILLI